MKITTTNTGQKYFTIYSVIGIKHNGERVCIQNHTTRKDAEVTRDIHNDGTFKELYKGVYVTSDIVWLKTYNRK